MGKDTLKSKNAILARKRLNEQLDKYGGSWREVERELKVNRGTLYHVWLGDRPPSDAVLKALKIKPPKYAPHPVVRRAKVERVLFGPYHNS